MPEPITRRATVDDVPFLVVAAMEADRSGGTRSSYAGLFGLSDEEVAGVLGEVISTGVDGHELSWTTACVVEVGGSVVAAVSGWVEGADETPSTIAKASVLFSVLGRERTREARPRLALLAPLTIQRQEGAIQLESIYVAPDHRRRGYVGALVDHHLERLGSRAPAAKAQILVGAGNVAAQSAYAKLGFGVAETRRSDDPRLDDILGDRGRVMMERNLTEMT